MKREITFTHSVTLEIDDKYLSGDWQSHMNTLQLLVDDATVIFNSTNAVPDIKIIKQAMEQWPELENPTEADQIVMAKGDLAEELATYEGHKRSDAKWSGKEYIGCECIEFGDSWYNSTNLDENECEMCKAREILDDPDATLEAIKKLIRYFEYHNDAE